MGTLSSLVDLSKSALQANQAALDVTGNNVANQNVVGYTRETLNWSSDVVQINGVSVGTGVSTGVSPVSQRDRVLEQRVQQQTQVSSQSTSLQSALNQLQSVFGLSATSASGTTTELSSAIDGLYSAFSSLAASPASSTVRQTALTAAGTLTSAFQSASGQIASVNSGLTQTAISTVSAINGLTATIASLNHQISTVSPNADAGALEDQRQAAVAQLSQYIGLDQVTTENNGLTLSTSSGAVLVAGAQSFALKASSVAGKTQITDGVSTVDISGQITGGQLGGFLAAQQNEIPALTSSLDQLAYAIGDLGEHAERRGTRWKRGGGRCAVCLEWDAERGGQFDCGDDDGSLEDRGGGDGRGKRGEYKRECAGGTGGGVATEWRERVELSDGCAWDAWERGVGRDNRPDGSAGDARAVDDAEGFAFGGFSGR